jgi:hypothetical protein
MITRVQALRWTGIGIITGGVAALTSPELAALLLGGAMVGAARAKSTDF